MRVGLIYDFTNPPRWQRDHAAVVADQLDAIAWAESLGIDDVWLPEHHFCDDGHAPSPLTMLAAIAARTSRVRIGTSVLLAPLYHPIRLAEEVALVDLLSGGRVDLGIGIGWAADEYEAFGVDPATRVGRTRELVDILRLAWSDEPVVFKGRHFTVDNVSVTPKPVQRPHPPIWGGANSLGAGRRIGTWGLPLLAVDPPVVAAYVEGLRETGRQAADGRLGGFLWMFVADDPDRAWDRIKDQLLYQRTRFSRPKYEPGGTVVPPSPPADLDALMQSLRATVMTPEAAVADIAAQVDSLGVKVDTVFCFGRLPGVPEELNRRHVELMATAVAPAFR